MLKKVRVAYWMLTGFIKKHTRLLILGVAIGVGGALAAPKLFSLIPKPKPTEKIAVVGRPTLAQLPLFIQNQISFGLTAITPSGEATPSLARSFRVEENGKRFIFTLRDDITWHDGKPLTASEVNYKFSDVKTIVNSDHEIAFELKEPFAPFPTLVSQPLFRQERSRVFPGRILLLGTGPMRVKKLSRNGPYITQIELKSADETRLYRFYNNQEAAILAFKLGEVDEILELSSPGELANWPNTAIEEKIHEDRYVALFFNTQDSNFASKSIRQALTYAIRNKPQDNTRALSPINPNSWAYNPQVKPYEFNLEQAKQLIEKETEGTGNFNPTIELTTTLPYLEIAEDIKEEWAKLGVQTTIKVATYLPENFQALLIAQEIPPDPDQYSLWHSTQSTNLTRYNSPKVEKLLEDGRQTLEKKERMQIYQDFQRFLVEDSPAAFLFHHRTYTVKRA